MKLPISAVILTYNEEKNIQTCLDSIKDFAQDIFIVDSFSTDKTLEIVKNYTDKIIQHKFETHTKQWKWALEELPIKTEWVFTPDADQSITDKLKKSFIHFLKNDLRDISGLYVSRKQIFLGRWIKYGGYYPKYLLKAFKKDKVLIDANELVDHHFYVNGKTMKLDGDLIENNLKENDLDFWSTKHLKYAELLAKEELSSSRLKYSCPEIATPHWISQQLKRTYTNMPLFLRAFSYFLYRYFIKFGFLDGREGLIFHFLQGCWFRFLVDAKIYEMKKRS